MTYTYKMPYCSKDISLNVKNNGGLKITLRYFVKREFMVGNIGL